MTPILPPWLQVQGEGGDLRLEVIVSPRATRTRVMGVHDERLKVQVAAPPAEGKANKALVRFIAEALGVSKAQVRVVGGASSTRKTLQLSGVSVRHAVLTLSPQRGV